MHIQSIQRKHRPVPFPLIRKCMLLNTVAGYEQWICHKKFVDKCMCVKWVYENSMKLKSCIKINLRRFYMKLFFQGCEKLFSQNSNIGTQNLTEEEEVKHIALCSPKDICVEDRTRSKEFLDSLSVSVIILPSHYVTIKIFKANSCSH